MLFNEPKLLKCPTADRPPRGRGSFSALQRAEIAEIVVLVVADLHAAAVSVLFNEPKLLKCRQRRGGRQRLYVSVLFNEPKLLKCLLFGTG